MPGGPSYARAEVELAPAPAVGLMMDDPSAGRSHCAARQRDWPTPAAVRCPVTQRRRPGRAACARASRWTASMADCALRTVSSSTPVRMPAAMSLRSASVNGPYSALLTGRYSSVADDVEPEVHAQLPNTFRTTAFARRVTRR